jgi:hypothetical protein
MKRFYLIKSIINYLKQIVEHRIKKLPITEILKDSFKYVGIVFGCGYGFNRSLHYSDGLVWRPTVGGVVGGTIGYTVGLFPFHAFGLLLVGDVAHTTWEKLKIKTK